MNSVEHNLLEDYKKFDFLNKNLVNIKILISYIKPSFLFKTEILTPIHLGRIVAKEGSKNGKISDEDLEWLFQNCFGDDDFAENISATNRRIGFLTGTYWAWKNYNKLGNPLYIGSFGYRKLFLANFLNNFQMYDAIIPTRDFNPNNKSNKERYILAYGNKYYELTTQTLSKFHPEDSKLWQNYMSEYFGYYHELYIFKKEIFFNFCNWIFPMLFELLKIPPEELLKTNEKISTRDILNFSGDIRDIAYIIERLTGFYCYKLSNSKDLKTYECPYIFLNMDKSIQENKKLIINFLQSKLQKGMNICQH